jgi:hypothetical protein
MGDLMESFLNPQARERLIEELAPHKGIVMIMTHGGGHWDYHAFIPQNFYPLLHCSPMQKQFYYYWWRAVSLAYMLRPNQATLDALTALNHLPFPPEQFEDCVAMFVRHGDKGIEMKLLEFPAYAEVSQHLWNHGMIPGSYHYLKQHKKLQGFDPDRSILTHGSEEAGLEDTNNNNNNNEMKEKEGMRRTKRSLLRTGQEGRSIENTEKEMKMVDNNLQIPSLGGKSLQDEIHIRRGRKLPFEIIEPQTTVAVEQSLDSPASSSSANDRPYYEYFYPNIPLNGTLFITTEDPKVLAEAEAFGRTHHWKILYTNLFDRSQQTAYRTWDEQHKKGAAAIHDPNEYLSMLLNLQVSTHCEAWVCTLASNSCRVMDEFRATVGGKANRFYADISHETCDHIPCIVGEHKSFGE